MNQERTELIFIQKMLVEYFEKAHLKIGVLDIKKLTGDASTRRYYRIITDSGNSYIACLDNPTGNELSPFEQVHNIFSKRGISIPRILYSSPTEGFLLEEDLGDQTLLLELANIENKERENALYKQAVAELIRIHNIETSGPETKIISSRKFDYEKLKFEIDLSNKYFLNKYCANGMSLEIEAVVREQFEKLIGEMINGPWVVTHRDYHSRNLMAKNDQLVVIDFQDARLGLPQYDLVSLLEDCYYHIDEDVKQSSIRYYYENLGSKYYKNFDDFMKGYYIVATQRIYKALGSFCYIYFERGDDRYLRYVGHGFEKLRSILLNLKNYKELKYALGRAYYGA